MASIREIQIGDNLYEFNKLLSNEAKIEVVKNKINLGIHPDTSNKETMLAVGFGESDEKPSNAMSLTYSGKLTAKEEVQVGEHKLTEKISLNDLQTKPFQIIYEDGTEEIINIVIN